MKLTRWFKDLFVPGQDPRVQAAKQKHTARVQTANSKRQAVIKEHAEPIKLKHQNT